MSRYRSVLALLAVAFSLTACATGGDGPDVATAGNAARHDTAAPAADPDARARQFVACMRAEGIEIDDSSGAGRGGPISAAEGDPKTNAALQKCRVYLPNGGEPAAVSPEDIEKARLYSRCIREHGVPDYPDPDPQTGQVKFTEELGSRLKSDPKMAAASGACRNFAAQPGAGTPGMGVG